MKKTNCREYIQGHYQEVLLDRDLRLHYLAKASQVLYSNGYLLEPTALEEQAVYSGRNGLFTGTLSCHAGLEFKGVYVCCYTTTPHEEREFKQFIDDCLNIAARKYFADDDFMKCYYKCLKTEFLITFVRKGPMYKAVYRGHGITELLRTKATVDEICTYINYVEDGYEHRD